MPVFVTSWGLASPRKEKDDTVSTLGIQYPSRVPNACRGGGGPQAVGSKRSEGREEINDHFLARSFHSQPLIFQEAATHNQSIPCCSSSFSFSQYSGQSPSRTQPLDFTRTDIKEELHSTASPRNSAYYQCWIRYCLSLIFSFSLPASTTIPYSPPTVAAPPFCFRPSRLARIPGTASPRP